MKEVPQTSREDKSWRHAASGSAFPPALPPRHPATAAVRGADEPTAPPSLIRDNAEAKILQHPLITAADYCDRKHLLSHISFLSGQLQRAELLLQKASRAMVSDEELARFDPLLAQGHIDRLESSLAQVALLREVELERSRALEEEVNRLRLERISLIERVDALDGRMATLEAENKQLTNALSSAQLEVERLRLEENSLHRRLTVIDQLQEDGHRYQGLNVIVAPPREANGRQECTKSMKELQMQETLQRLSLLVDMLMEPICIAFDAGVVWITETQLHRASLQLQNVTVPGYSNDAFGLQTSVEGNSPLGDVDDVTLTPAAIGVEFFSEAKLRNELKVARERCRVAEQQRERMKCLLQEEQKRTEDMAKEQYQQLQQVHEQMVHERQHIMESLVGEVEEKMRNAFRDGRLYEKRLREEKLQKRRVSAGQSNGAAGFAQQRRAGNLPHGASMGLEVEKQFTAGSRSSSGSTGGRSSGR
ncbi:hypothetical protein C3747_11g76 [Trypanosoma cruzi]|uniref:Uncharacterized protein n=2 Tax=Trypanosoma cruzi TaxID=5693 RepID=Q4D4K1_TRYCC|nr:hypothetical protein, conserved [Trypanosoma cruzi]EAN87453.1 hypothetical protein, conserved [Trypanosoma cruzi]PWV18970.1 hypothetical protein C3747_11g76 [Trypanosoma cruzi]|eukprot:XP_809304.1 hypothetical protein [Trypanosoma cruzi strain CL Brener]